jgi:hypothetical protein
LSLVAPPTGLKDFRSFAIIGSIVEKSANVCRTRSPPTEKMRQPFEAARNPFETARSWRISTTIRSRQAISHFCGTNHLAFLSDLIFWKLIDVGPVTRARANFLR